MNLIKPFLLLAAVVALSTPVQAVAQRPSERRLDLIDQWVRRELQNIAEDPSFFLMSETGPEAVYPWENLRVNGDTVTVQIPSGHPQTLNFYYIYGHLHLMVTMGRQEEWLPEAPAAVGFELERAILARLADAWIYARTRFAMRPYGPLDELTESQEAGFLDAFIFTTRPDEFAATRAEWARSHPGEMERYRDWFIETFDREPLELRPG